MIWIVYNRKSGELVAEGHAGSAPTGQDIVCAGVSTCLDTMVYMLAYLLPSQRVAEYSSHGYQRIRAKGRRARRIMDAAAAVLRQIAEQYPDHVRLVEKEKK